METCRYCNEKFNKVSYQQVYCSELCRGNYHSDKQKIRVAKNGPLSKPVKCIECKVLFIREHSTIKTCSDKCKSVIKKKQKKRQTEKQKQTDKYLRARTNHINECVECLKKFKARNHNQKCCDKDCRAIYSRKYRAEIEREYNTDINIRIAKNLRSRVSRAVKNDLRGGSAVSDLGCSIKELKKYLEAQFHPNPETGEVMSWDNYGRDGWHIDHIKPLAAFTLTDKDEFKEAAHYTNLQPMWASENISKGAKYDDE